MAKDDRSPLNPFTGRKHYDKVNDDQFLAECYREYYAIINKAQINVLFIKPFNINTSRYNINVSFNIILLFK